LDYLCLNHKEQNGRLSERNGGKIERNGKPLERNGKPLERNGKPSEKKEEPSGVVNYTEVVLSVEEPGIFVKFIIPSFDYIYCCLL
jgi:hypothetical protein